LFHRNNPGTKAAWDGLSEEVFEKTKSEIIDEYEKRCGSQVRDPKLFEILVVIAEKA